MTQEEKSEIIAMLRTEVLSMRASEYCYKSLKPTMDKWVNSDKLQNVLPKDILGCSEKHKVWDCIRKITCVIEGVSRVDRIQNIDEANEIADKLCESVYEVAKARVKA